jgi:hypothetical protein
MQRRLEHPAQDALGLHRGILRSGNDQAIAVRMKCNGAGVFNSRQILVVLPEQPDALAQFAEI